MAIKDEVVDELLKDADPKRVFSSEGLLAEIKKALAERMLNAEMDQHLDAEAVAAGEPSGNHRNGYSKQTVTTDTSQVELDIPRDRRGTFEPQLIAKYQRRFPGFDDKIISMYARGMSVRDIQGHLRELYGIEASPQLISTVTDAVLEEVGLCIFLFEACSAFTRVTACTLATSPSRDAYHRRLQLLRHLHSCSGCFRLEHLPGGALTHWKTPPCHGAPALWNIGEPRRVPGPGPMAVGCDRRTTVRMTAALGLPIPAAFATVPPAVALGPAMSDATVWLRDAPVHTSERCAATRTILSIVAAAFCAVHGTTAAVAAVADAGGGPATQALHRLLDSEWEWELAQFPERATFLGDHRYDHRLTDGSPAAVAVRREHHRERLVALRAIDRSALTGEDRLSRDILAFDFELAVRGDELLRFVTAGRDLPFSSDDSPLDINQMNGPQFNLRQLVLATRFQDEPDYRHYLARLMALPTRLQQLKVTLEAGRRAGWMPPRVAVQRLPGQFAALLNPDLTKHPLYAPFQTFPADLPGATQTELAQAGERTIHETVIPALKAFRDYLAGTWVPAGTATLGAMQLPHGAEYYSWSLQRYNTTRMSAQEIHELGLREVARIDAELRSVMREAGFTGTLAEFRGFLRTDKRFQFATAEEELVAFRDIAKRIDPQLPRLFVELPRLPYGVRAMTPEEGNNAPHYIRGAVDGSRAGYFEPNTNSLAAWPRWTMDALVLHEAVPGHHLQIARAEELPGLPKLRRAYNNSGFSEGWALYAEGLGKELGLYADPYSRFGRLTLEAHRACRLVVDTGMHAFGWSRDQAIDYLIEHGQLERGFAEAEIDRYLVWPGQATAYKVGEQRILELRDKAKKALGSRFDIRRFHNAVLDHGALPLAVLEGVIDEWIEAERADHAP